MFEPRKIEPLDCNSIVKKLCDNVLKDTASSSHNVTNIIANGIIYQALFYVNIQEELISEPKQPTKTHWEIVDFNFNVVLEKLIAHMYKYHIKKDETEKWIKYKNIPLQILFKVTEMDDSAGWDYRINLDEKTEHNLFLMQAEEEGIWEIFSKEFEPPRMVAIVASPYQTSCMKFLEKNREWLLTSKGMNPKEESPEIVEGEKSLYEKLSSSIRETAMKLANEDNAFLLNKMGEAGITPQDIESGKYILIRGTLINQYNEFFREPLYSLYTSDMKLVFHIMQRELEVQDGIPHISYEVIYGDEYDVD